MPEERIVFKDDDEASAWDMYVAAFIVDKGEPPAVFAAWADAMILERRKCMAPEKVEREWIPHKPGDPMPCDKSMLVDIKIEGGSSYADQAANKINWSDCFRPVIAWRPA